MTTEQANQLKSIYERVDKLSPTVTKIVIPYSHQAILYKGQAGDSGACTGSGNITIILHGAKVISATVDGGTADGTGTGGWELPKHHMALLQLLYRLLLFKLQQNDELIKMKSIGL